jgi:ABC-type nitrate/sulfonate/bicarbonate transport system substrate-binding protein
MPHHIARQQRHEEVRSMGATGVSPFENDDALDFLDELEDAQADERPALVQRVLRRVLRSRGYVEAPSMAEAVAAAAVVAVSADPPDEPRETIHHEPYLPAWVLSEPLEVDDDLFELARRTFDRALNPDDNEWWEMWTGAGLTSDVQESIDRYKDRLGAE